MDDEKKYTSENENNKDNRIDEFGDFNFTDEFSNEFSDDFSKKTTEEDDFFSTPAQKNDAEDDFFSEEMMQKPQDDIFADDFGKTDDFGSSDFDKKIEDDFFTQDFTKKPAEDDFFASDFDKKPDEDFFASDFTQKPADDMFANDDFSESQTPPMSSFDNGGDNVPPATTQRTNIMKRHPFITILVVITMIFGGYNLMKRAGNNEITPVAATTKPQIQQHPIPASAPAEIKQIDERLDALEKGMLQISDQLQMLQGSGVRLEQMEQMVTKIVEEERDLNDTLVRLEALSKQVDALTQLSQRINVLDAQMQAMTGSVELYTTVSEQTQREANLSRQAMQAKSMMPVPMVVQAAIPGRAWLMSEFGELITVARGDEVPGYGRVMNIDPVAGTVTMSSETVFREEAQTRASQ